MSFWLGLWQTIKCSIDNLFKVGQITYWNPFLFLTFLFKTYFHSFYFLGLKMGLMVGITLLFVDVVNSILDVINFIP
jgi:hypothetical protein